MILDFAKEETTKTFTIANTGSGTLEWDIDVPEYISGSDWISEIDPIAGKTYNTTDIISVTVDRSSLNNGIYAATIPITSVGGGNQGVLINIEQSN